MCFSRKIYKLVAAGGFSVEAGVFTVAILVDKQILTVHYGPSELDQF